MAYEFYLQTGCKFFGSEEEFWDKLPNCTTYTPWTDDDGCFDCFLCTKDFKECKKDCNNHHQPRKLDPDWEEYFVATCERYRDV
jgi:hypothetical protein